MTAPPPGSSGQARDAEPGTGGFGRLWAAQVVSGAGDQITTVALPILAVVMLGATSTQMGLLTAAGRAPVLVVGLLAGVLVDRVRRRRLMIGCDLARALALCAVPAAALIGWASMALLAVVVFVVGCLGTVFNTASVAMLPSLAARDRLMTCNARLTQTRALLRIGGPGLGGALVQALTAPWAIALDVSSFGASAAILRRVREQPLPAQASGHRSIRRDAADGMRFAVRHPLLRASAGAAGTYGLFSSAILALQVLYLSRTLGLSATEIGLVMAAVGPGALLGAALANAFGRRFGVGPTMIGGLILTALPNLVPPLVRGAGAMSVSVICLAMLVNGFGQPLYNVTQASLRQAIVPAQLQGRVTATMTVVAGGAAPLGALLGGLAGQHLGVRPTLVCAALGTLTACLWPLLSPVRSQIGLPAADGSAHRSLGIRVYQPGRRGSRS